MTTPDSAAAGSEPKRAGHGQECAAVPAVIDRVLAARIADEAIRRYAQDRRARIPAFIDRHFSLAGSLRLHRRAVGRDLVRGPVNLMLAVPQLGLELGAAAGRAAARRLPAAGAVPLRALADRLEARRLFLETDVGAEIEWLLYAELIELPYAQAHPRLGRRVTTRDALAEAIFADPRIDEALRRVVGEIARCADDPDFRARLTDLMVTYTSSRAAATDIASSLLSLGVGALAFRQITPGLLSLGPAIAGAIAKHMAVASFPLGAGLGGLWYGVFPAHPAPLLIAGVGGSLFLAAASLTAFAGVIADPVQRRLGLHRRRLERLVAAIETDLRGEGPAGFVLRDHYVARVLDLLDVLRAIQRLAQ